MSQGAQMVVLPALQHLHFPRRPPHRAAMAGRCLPVLPQGARTRPERSEAEGAEGQSPEQAGVRGHFYDRGQGLGRRTHFGTNDHWTDSRKCIFCVVWVDELTFPPAVWK